MQWLEVSIHTTSTGIEALADYLTANGYDSFILDDSEDFRTFLKDNVQYWDYVDEDLAKQMEDISRIRLFIEQDNAPTEIENLKSILERFRTVYGKNAGTLELSLEDVREEDWENSWKQYYQPIPVGKKLLIVPCWLSSNGYPGRIPLLLDPGMIFGTGSHASTQMCLRALEHIVSGGEQVIDLGSGSGILSIAALLLGVEAAIGVDIDPKAEDIARENAALNGFTYPRFKAVTGNVISDRSMMEHLSAISYDIVLANIVADVIIPLSCMVPRFMKPGARFICSGILDVRLPEVVSSLESAGLQIIQQDQQDDWCCLIAALK